MRISEKERLEQAERLEKIKRDDLTKKQKVVIDEKTVIYVSMDKDPEKARENWLKRYKGVSIIQGYIVPIE